MAAWKGVLLLALVAAVAAQNDQEETCPCRRTTFSRCSIPTPQEGICVGTVCQGYSCVSQEESTTNCRLRTGFFLRASGSVPEGEGEQTYECEQVEMQIATPIWVQRGPNTPCLSAQTFELVFNYNWTADIYPLAEYPDNARFGGAVVAAHTGSFSIWSRNSFATIFVQELAETGSIFNLLQSVVNSRNVDNAAYFDGFVDATDELRLRVTVNPLFPRISAIVGMRPSPDFFIGVDSTDLCNSATGEYRRSTTVNLFPYDAGTRDGPDFLNPGDDVDPPAFISFVNEDVVTRRRTVATLTINAIDS